MEKALWMICITHMFVEVYLLVQVALIPVMIREFQLNLLEASLVATIPSLIAILTNIPFGIMADRFGSNHLLSISMLVEGISAFFVSQTGNFWVLVFGVSLMRISSPLHHISGLSRISQLAKQEQIGRSMGYHNALGNLGSGAGVISLTLFLSTLGWRWVYLFWSFPILIWGFIILTSSQLKAKRVVRRKTQWGNRLKGLTLVFSSGFLSFLIAVGISHIGITGSSTFMTAYFVEVARLSEAGASLIFGLGPFFGIVGSLFGGYLTERFRAKRTLSLTTLGCAIALSIISFFSELYLAVLAYILYAFFSSIMWSPINSIVAHITPCAQRGLSYSFFFFTIGLTASIAPILTAAVIQLTEIWFAIPCGIIFLVTSVAILQFQNHLGVNERV